MALGNAKTPRKARRRQHSTRVRRKSTNKLLHKQQESGETDITLSPIVISFRLAGLHNSDVVKTSGPTPHDAKIKIRYSTRHLCRSHNSFPVSEASSTDAVVDFRPRQQPSPEQPNTCRITLENADIIIVTTVVARTSRSESTKRYSTPHLNQKRNSTSVESRLTRLSTRSGRCPDESHTSRTEPFQASFDRLAASKTPYQNQDPRSKINSR